MGERFAMNNRKKIKIETKIIFKLDKIEFKPEVLLRG